MKTTIDIPDGELEDAIRFTNAKTKREAVVGAIADFNRRMRMAELIKHAGTCDRPDYIGRTPVSASRKLIRDPDRHVELDTHAFVRTATRQCGVASKRLDRWTSMLVSSGAA